MYKKIATVSALAALASAQVPGISSNCTNGIVGLASDQSISQCIAFNGLIGLATLGQNDSIIPPLEQYHTQLCAAPACDDAAVLTAVQNVLSACGPDLSSFGLDTSSSTVQQVVQEVPQIIAAAKRFLCLRDNTVANTETASNGLCTANVTFCSIETLESVQTAVGQNLSISLATSLMEPGAVDQLLQAINAAPSSAKCTSCVAAQYQVLNESLATIGNIQLDDASIMGQSIPQILDGECGAGFAETNFTTGMNVTEQSSYCQSSTAAQRLRLRRWV